jgi:DNA-binding transcriptional MerR regulator
MNAALAQYSDESAVAVRRSQKAEDAYRTISEVADELNVAQHVLRFWESKFKQIEPMKRAGGRRYYRREDVDLLQRIHFLLYSQGYTIKGVQKLLLKDKRLLQSVPHTQADVTADTLSPSLRPPVASPVATTPTIPSTPPAMGLSALSHGTPSQDESPSLFQASDRVMMLDILRRLKGLQSLLNA